MTQNGEQKSPNDILAEQITQELVEVGLIEEKHKAELESKLKNRGVSQDDWNLWVDLATVPEKDGEATHD